MRERISVAQAETNEVPTVVENPDDMDVDVVMSDRPAQSLLVRNPKVEFNLNTEKGKAAMMELLPTAVQNQLNQKFGKDDKNHVFTNEFTIRHCLLPIYFRNYLTKDEWQFMRQHVPTVDRLCGLLDDYGKVDFRPLRENYFPADWETATDFNRHRSAQLTSCFLFYQGSAAAVVRYIGGPFVGAHRDIPKILRNIRGHVPGHIYEHIKRLLTVGVPAHCNASSTDANLQEYLKYGNHVTADRDLPLLRKTLLKDEKRGHALFLDERLVEFVLNLHVCPGGLIDLAHKIKVPRPIYDASFHPLPVSMTCNDWTSSQS